MNKKRIKLQSVVGASVLILYGIVVFINSLTGGKISASVGNWYEMIFLMLTTLCLINYIVKKAPQYSMPIVIFLSVYLFLRLSRAPEVVYNYRDLFFMVPLGVGLGLVISYILTKGESGFLKSGLIISLFSAIFLIASIRDIYGYVLPSIIIAIGIIWIVSALSKKRLNFFSADNEKQGYVKNANRTYKETIIMTEDIKDEEK